jgi:hypothetical protein
VKTLVLAGSLKEALVDTPTDHSSAIGEDMPAEDLFIAVEKKLRREAAARRYPGTHRAGLAFG